MLQRQRLFSTFTSMTPTMKGVDSVGSRTEGSVGSVLSVDALELNLASKGDGPKTTLKDTGKRYVYLSEECCRAFHSSNGERLVCGNVSACGRHGHKQAVNAGDRGLAGFYEGKAVNRFTDGKLESFMSEEQMQAMEDEHRMARRSELAALTGRSEEESEEEDDRKMAATDGLVPQVVAPSVKDRKLLPEVVTVESLEEEEAEMAMMLQAAAWDQAKAQARKDIFGCYQSSTTTADPRAKSARS